MDSHLLMIDDDERIVKSLKRYFELRGGWRFSSALSPAEGRAFLEKEKPDVLILDCNMGNDEEAGLRFLKKMRADPRHKDLPVLILTGTRRQRDKIAEGFEMGADQYLLKPIRPADLVQRLEALLRFVQRTGG